jgi:UDP-N-acetylmuramoyl-tripeptide--D-alanyl-D-alanine ligase
MKSAIDTLSTINTKGRKIAVLADMLELGEDSIKFHKEIGKHLKKSGIDLVLTYGQLSGAIIEEFGIGGLHFVDKNLLADKLLKLTEKNDVILFKGSRGMKLEEVVAQLKQRLG